MKNFLLAIPLFFIGTVTSGQNKFLTELPANVLNEPVILTLTVDESIFEELSNIVKTDLNLLGIKVVQSFNIDENPTRRARQMDTFNSLVDEVGAEIVVGVTFINYALKNGDLRSVYKKNKAFITVMSAVQLDSKYPEIFMINEKSYQKALSKLKEELTKQKD